MSRTIAIDFETYYDNECSVKTLGNWAYSHHPDWEAYMVSVCDGSETWVGHPKEFNWRALEGAKLVSHNAFFDRSVYRRLVELNQAPDGLDTDWRCSSNLGAYLCGSQRSLKDVSKKLLGVDLSKDVRDQAKGLRWSQMQAEGFADKMLEYARRDAHLCHQIWDRFSGRMPEPEHQLSDLTIRNSMFGIRINRALLEEYISALRQGIFATEKQIPWIAEDYKPTSTKAFAEWCRRDNIPVPPTKEEDEEGVDKWTELYSPGRPWVQAVGAWRSLNKTLKRFLLIQSRLRPDDTMDFGLKYFGAHTGRYSGDAGFNIQNQRKQPILLREDWTMVTDKFEVDQILKDGVPDGWSVIDERSLIVPREGHKFIIADLSQIEPRVLNTLVGNHELLDKIRSGMAIYEAFARQSLGYSDPAALKKKDARLYALAKAEVLGLGYQCGKKRFPEVAWIMAGLRIDEAESEKAVTGFRETNPKIVGLWNTLDSAFKQSCGSDFEMELPSGRVMKYEKVRASRRIDVDEETGLPKAKTVYTAEVAGRRVQLYGGKLTENCLAGWTRVLSERRGWVRLDSVTTEDRLWDGVGFVRHSGLSTPRKRPVITRFGVTATPDHKFAQKNSWVPFGCFDITEAITLNYGLPTVATTEPNRENFRGTDGASQSGIPAGSVQMGRSVLLWCGYAEGGQGDGPRESAQLQPTVPGEPQQNIRVPGDAPKIPAPGLCGVALHAGPVQQPQTPSLPQLRGSRDSSVSRMDKIRGFLVRGRSILRSWLGLGPDRQQRRLPSRQRALGAKGFELPEQTEHSLSGWFPSRLLGPGRITGHTPEHVVLPDQGRTFVGTDLQHTTEHEELVYDVVDCGPRHRFAVLSTEGVLLAHNCTQAVARDIFVGHILELDKRGLNPLFSVHDEAVCEVPTDTPVQAVLDVMSQPPAWFPACPVAAEAVEANRYLK